MSILCHILQRERTLSANRAQHAAMTGNAKRPGRPSLVISCTRSCNVAHPLILFFCSIVTAGWRAITTSPGLSAAGAPVQHVPEALRAACMRLRQAAHRLSSGFRRTRRAPCFKRRHHKKAGASKTLRPADGRYLSLPGARLACSQAATVQLCAVPPRRCSPRRAPPCHLQQAPAKARWRDVRRG